MIGYLGIALLLGIVSGAIHNIILVRHVLPYMKERGVDVCGPLQFNRTYSEYLRIDDPKERKVKLALRLLKIPFLIAILIVGFVIYSMAMADR